MGTPKKRREIESMLRKPNWAPIRNRGGHEVWGCPCGSHTTPLPNHREISSGVVTSIEKQMKECR